MFSEKEPLVILIEDEQQIRRFLRVTLADYQFQLIEASTGNEGLIRVSANQPDLILLDLGLPDIDGVEVIRKVRQGSSVPIIILSARGQEEEKITALDAGADDYITKPFGIGELLARMRAALRRAKTRTDESASPVYDCGDLRINFETRLVTANEKEVHLTPNEYDLLTLLVKNAGRVLTHNQLLKGVWGENYVAETHYLRVYMAQLRHKLESDPARPKHLLTEPGIGYRFKV